MKTYLRRAFVAALLASAPAATSAYATDPVLSPLAKEMVNPESVAVGISLNAKGFPQFTIAVSEIGEFNKAGDGKVTIVAGAEKKTLADGLDDPKGMVYVGDQLFVTDNTKVWRVGVKGGKEVFAAAEAFPTKPMFLNDIEADAAGNLYVTDSGDLKGAGGAVYKIAADGKVTTVVDSKNPKIKTPNGLLIDGPDHLLVLDYGSGELNRLSLKDGSMELIADGLKTGDGLARDFDNNVYATQVGEGIVSILKAGKGPAVPHGPKLKGPADLALNPKTGQLLIPDLAAGTVVGLSIVSNAPTDIDVSPLAGVKIAPAFQKIEEEIERPIVLTHAGDGSGRVFIASQLGNIYMLDKADDAAEPKLWFDFQKHVSYKDNENEEGLLGFCFHPKFKDNGRFFVFYTKKDAPPHTSVVSGFTLAKGAATADAASEKEVIRVPQPYWNHNGGTIAFGPDGMLYIALGDGGMFNDPEKNGQNIATLNGSILRVDIDHADEGLGYSVPKDNPFVGRKDAKGEIWAYGIRNIWRLAFDKKSGALWAADVGQDIWEEINIVVKGGNYGWNKREGMHQFRADGSQPKPEYIEPIWEYHHDLGRSITGGAVYRGTQVPALEGKYVYSDYIRGTVWALTYDAAAKKVLANQTVGKNVLPVVSFGEDEAGELYFLTSGNRCFRFTTAK